jgi:glycosyltransferase involved in cell wall biosynthesis
MAVGLPLVTLETPHFRELLGDDYPLFAADGEELVTALESLRSDPAFSAQVGTRNAGGAAASRAWTSVAEQVELLYAGVSCSPATRS